MLRLVSPVWERTLEILAACGAGRDECVALWTGPLGEPDVVDRALHPSHSKTPWNYRIDSAWLHELHLSLYRERRAIRAQIHTHKGTAFHSATDDEYPAVSAAGFVSLVLPHFAVGKLAVDDIWIAKLDDRGRWAKAEPADTIEGWPR
jgi:hypothetical protein